MHYKLSTVNEVWLWWAIETTTLAERRVCPKLLKEACCSSLSGSLIVPGENNRIVQCPELEGTHKDQVLTPSLGQDNQKNHVPESIVQKEKKKKGKAVAWHTKGGLFLPCKC